MDCEKYNNALEKAKVRYNEIKDTDCSEEKFLLDLFPELKESEDERIRKALVRFHKSTIDVDGIKGEDILAWLEKQGEQKVSVDDFKAKDWYVSNVDGKIHDMTYNPTDKAEPKFKVGDVMRTLQEATDGIVDGMPVVISIDKEYYHCTNELIAIKDQDDYEFPPINVKQKPTWSDEDEKIIEEILDAIEAVEYEMALNMSDVRQWLKNLKQRLS